MAEDEMGFSVDFSPSENITLKEALTEGWLP